MQKVESDEEPRPQATSQKKLFLSSPSSPERPNRGIGALACAHDGVILGQAQVMKILLTLIQRTSEANTLLALQWSKYQNLTCLFPTVTK